MPHFRFQAQKIIEAASQEEAEQIFASVTSCTFGADAPCEELSDHVEGRESILNSDYALYSIFTQNVQSVAEEEFGRMLTEMELATIEHKLDDYVDLHETVALCICQELER